MDVIVVKDGFWKIEVVVFVLFDVVLLEVFVGLLLFFLLELVWMVVIVDVGVFDDEFVDEMEEEKEDDDEEEEEEEGKVELRFILVS